MITFTASDARKVTVEEGHVTPGYLIDKIKAEAKKGNYSLDISNMRIKTEDAVEFMHNGFVVTEKTISWDQEVNSKTY